MILAVLETRGIPVSEDQRQEILRCTDLARLDRWSRRAVLAASEHCAERARRTMMWI